MGTLKIGSASNKKGVTINPSVVLFNGNNVKKIMSGLIEIWNDIKPLIPTMTSNTTPSGEAFANYVFSGTYAPWIAFNGTNSNYADAWTANENPMNYPYWIGYRFEKPVVVKDVMIANRNFTTVNAVKDFILQGSNDNSKWVNIKSFTNTITGQSVEFHCDVSENNTAYLYYRLYITSSHGVELYIAKIQFYGY